MDEHKVQLEDYLNKKFIFDENNKCIEAGKDVIRIYNKSEHVKKISL